MKLFFTLLFLNYIVACALPKNTKNKKILMFQLL